MATCFIYTICNVRALGSKTPPQSRGRLQIRENNIRTDEKVEFGHQTISGRVAEGWFFALVLHGIG